jgi:hypothetical protein
MGKSGTLVKCIFEYKGKEYSVEDIISYYLDEELALYLYEYGDSSYDNYRADLVRIKYGEDEISNLTGSSKEIKLINIELEYK